MLRLVATDNKGEPLATCVIRVRVIAQQQESSAINPVKRLSKIQVNGEDRIPYARN